MSDKKEMIFTNGMFCDEHKFDSGDVITKLSFRKDEFIEWLNQHVNEKGYVNVIVGKGQSGKLYGRLDTWQPKPSNQPQSNPQDANNQDTSYQGEHNQALQSTPQDNGLPAMPADINASGEFLDDDTSVPF